MLHLWTAFYQPEEVLEQQILNPYYDNTNMLPTPQVVLDIISIIDERPKAAWYESTSMAKEKRSHMR